jgi:hypothetical protein
MADKVMLYISAMQDLEIERDTLSRAVVEIPVSIGWQIDLTPIRGEPPNLELVKNSDIHIIVFGCDIRAPFGLEWHTSRRANKRTRLFLKKGILRTPAAQAFLQNVKNTSDWHLFSDSSHLRHQALLVLSEFLIDQAVHYPLDPQEYENLISWRKVIQQKGAINVEEVRSGTGESSVILSSERYNPPQEVLIKPVRKQ